MTSTFWKNLLLPPLFALIIYLFAIHIFFPLYNRLRSRYSSSAAYLPASLSSRFSSLQTFIHPGRSSLSGSESLLGDEELEEGLLEDTDHIGRGRDEGERRLSRELEVGFRDESDDEEEEEEEEEEEDRRGRKERR